MRVSRADDHKLPTIHPRLLEQPVEDQRYSRWRIQERLPGERDGLYNSTYSFDFFGAVIGIIQRDNSTLPNVAKEIDGVAACSMAAKYEQHREWLVRSIPDNAKRNG